MTRFASDLKGAATTVAFRRSARPTAPPPPGARAVFLGDSITNGSSAAAGQRWVDQVPKILGNAISQNSVVRGWPGQRSDQIAARYDQDVRGNGAQVLFVLAGTNDASQGRTLAQYAASIRTIVTKAQQDGIAVILGTVPPRGSSVAASITTLLQQYNAWIRLWAPANGVKVAETFQALVNSPYLAIKSGYDSGDGTHPETVGHEKIAEAFAAAFTSLTTLSPNPHLVEVSGGGFNLASNPLFAGASSSGWYEQPGGTGTAPTYSFQADTSGALQFGTWREMAFDATSSGGTRYYCTSIGTVTPGQRLLITARLALVDIAGGFYAAAQGSAPTAQFQLKAMDGSFVQRAAYGGSVPVAPGPVQRVFAVPAGMTQLILAFQCTLPTGQSAKFRIGEIGVFDVTQLPDLAAAAAP